VIFAWLRSLLTASLLSHPFGKVVLVVGVVFILLGVLRLFGFLPALRLNMGTSHIENPLIVGVVLILVGAAVVAYALLR
jgi:hypothetical protein